MDLVCGMEVDPGRVAAKIEHHGKTYYFCCDGCLNLFRADPAKYLAAPANAGPIHASQSRAPTASMSDTASRPPFQYTCPMHPQIVRDRPGACPICGMALEPHTPTLHEDDNAELRDMTRRFWIGLVLTAPLLLIAMTGMVPAFQIPHTASSRMVTWVQLLLATPVVLYCGWPFFVRGWASIVNRSLNMFT